MLRLNTLLKQMLASQGNTEKKSESEKVPNNSYGFGGTDKAQESPSYKRFDGLVKPSQIVKASISSTNNSPRLDNIRLYTESEINSMSAEERIIKGREIKLQLAGKDHGITGGLLKRLELQAMRLGYPYDFKENNLVHVEGREDNINIETTNVEDRTIGDAKKYVYHVTKLPAAKSIAQVGHIMGGVFETQKQYGTTLSKDQLIKQNIGQIKQLFCCVDAKFLDQFHEFKPFKAENEKFISAISDKLHTLFKEQIEQRLNNLCNGDLTLVNEIKTAKDLVTREMFNQIEGSDASMLKNGVAPKEKTVREISKLNSTEKDVAISTAILKKFENKDPAFFNALVIPGAFKMMDEAMAGEGATYTYDSLKAVSNPTYAKGDNVVLIRIPKSYLTENKIATHADPQEMEAIIFRDRVTADQLSYIQLNPDMGKRNIDKQIINSNNAGWLSVESLK